MLKNLLVYTVAMATWMICEKINNIDIAFFIGCLCGVGLTVLNIRK